MFPFRTHMVAAVALSCVSWMGCGEDVTTKNEGMTEAESFSLSFETDYLDIYGDISIEFEGTGHTWVLSAEKPTGCIEWNAGQVAYQARSSRGFTWEGSMALSRGDCPTVSLDAEHAKDTWLAITEHDASSVPVEVGIDGETVGTVLQSWIPSSPHADDAMDCGRLRRHFLDSAREGKAVILPMPGPIVFTTQNVDRAYAMASIESLPDMCLLPWPIPADPEF